MDSIENRTRTEFNRKINELPSDVKNSIGTLDEKKNGIKFSGWKKSIINSLIHLDNDYDLNMPGDDKKKQIFKDDLINIIGDCTEYNCVNKILKKVYKDKEIINKIMEKAYEHYSTKGVGKKTKDETTTSASSGQYSGPLFGGKPKFKSNVKIKRTEIERIVKEAVKGTDESTTSSSAGAYVGPAMWAKDRDNWRGRIKTWKGGKFVNIKPKCKKYPYCNQSPEAITLSDIPLDKLDKIFEDIGKKTKKPYSMIKRVFFDHFDLE